MPSTSTGPSWPATTTGAAGGVHRGGMGPRTRRRPRHRRRLQHAQPRPFRRAGHPGMGAELLVSVLFPLGSGRRGLEQNRDELCELLWRTWSPAGAARARRFPPAPRACTTGLRRTSSSTPTATGTGWPTATPVPAVRGPDRPGAAHHRPDGGARKRDDGVGAPQRWQEGTTSPALQQRVLSRYRTQRSAGGPGRVRAGRASLSGEGHVLGHLSPQLGGPSARPEAPGPACHRSLGQCRIRSLSCCVRIHAAAFLRQRGARLFNVPCQRVDVLAAHRLLDQGTHDRHVLGVRRQGVCRHHPAALGRELQAMSNSS